MGAISGTTLGPFSGGYLDVDRCYSSTNLHAHSPGAMGALRSLLTFSEGAEIWDGVGSIPVSSPGSPLWFPLKVFRYLVISHLWKYLDLYMVVTSHRW